MKTLNERLDLIPEEIAGVRITEKKVVEENRVIVLLNRPVNLANEIIAAMEAADEVTCSTYFSAAGGASAIVFQFKA